jgi:hypothetical protein
LRLSFHQIHDGENAMSENKTDEGSCFCGAVQFAVSGETLAE